MLDVFLDVFGCAFYVYLCILCVITILWIKCIKFYVHYNSASDFSVKCVSCGENREEIKGFTPEQMYNYFGVTVSLTMKTYLKDGYHAPR